MGQSALAITDHGSLGGAFSIYEHANTHGIKPIIGIEVYHAPSSRQDKTPVYWGSPEQKKSDVGGQGAYTHLTLLARNADGLRNLYRMHHLASTEGFYRKPRVDNDLLYRFREGVICLSGCMGGAVATRLKLGQVDEAEDTAAYLAEVFRDNFFVELMDHGFAEEKAVTEGLIELAHKMGLPMVATNDSHYTRAEDAEVQKALLHLQTYGAFTGFDGSGYHLRSREEMSRLGLPVESLDSSVVIAEVVESYAEVFKKRLLIPKPLGEWPEYLSMADVLVSKAGGGLVERGIRETGYEQYWRRLNYELSVIENLFFENYFLVLAGIVQEAKRRGARVGPGRGSAGGSLVAYALRITELDPLAHGLVFERFLNPQRASFPDIDIDIQPSRREEMRDWVRKEFGEEYVALIGTTGMIKAKAALQDANRVLGGQPATAAKLKSLLPPDRYGRTAPLSEGDWDGLSDTEQRVVNLAYGLEGLIRQPGQHAGGLVISPIPLQEVLPVRRVAKTKGAEDTTWEGVVTEFPMEAVEALGLVKYDFLGLNNLDTIDSTFDFLGYDFALPTLPEECDDRATYQLLQSGDTLGVFQLDSDGMRRLLREVRPTTFNDISAVLALYRPGPMGANAHKEFARRKNGKVAVSRIHPELDLDDILGETYGLVVFQEQVLAALAKVCGWTYAEADLLFNAMRKKDHAKLEAGKPGFFAAAQDHGTSVEAATSLWDVLVPFADYSFNKAHTAGYGLVAYWTAYLKANHPNEYMAALLTGSKDDPDKLHEYLAECGRIGVRMLPPDINTSGSGFTPTPDGIRYGLSAIKGVGEKATEALTASRPYADLPTFFRSIPKKALNVGSLRALVKAGGLDSLYDDRVSLHDDIERLAELASRERDISSDTLFPYSYTPKRTESGGESEATLHLWEQETLGVSISKPKRVLDVQRPLSVSEWTWLRQVLHGGSDIEYTLTYNGKRVAHGLCNLTDPVKESLNTLGVVIN